MASEILRLTTASGHHFHDPAADPNEAEAITLTKDGDRLKIQIGETHVQLTPEEADEVMSTICDFLRSVGA